MKKLLSGLLVAILCGCCVACRATVREPENTVTEYLIDYIDEFNDPESVSVVMAKMNTKEGDFVELKISEENSSGKIITREYILVLNTVTVHEKEIDAGTIVCKDDKSVIASSVKFAYAEESLERWGSLKDVGNVENIELDVSYINEILNKHTKG